MIKNILITLFLFYGALSKAQQFNYVHYDTKDGLAGSTVYDMCQDKDGFMWFATENGLSRYDGSVYVNYTVKDGLPDNEVLKLYADSKGRVWIGTFNKEVCYYFKGKIYNKQNDSVLKQIHLTNFLASIAEDDNGVVAISDESTSITIVNFENTITVKKYTFSSKAGAVTFKTCEGRRIMVGDRENNAYLYQNNHFKEFNAFKGIYKSATNEVSYILSYISCDGKLRRFLPRKPNYLLINAANNYLLFYSTFNGSWGVDTAANIWDMHYLEGKKITRTIEDAEKNLWFSTIGEGVYKLSSKEIETYKFPETNEVKNEEVFSIFKTNNNLTAGLNHGHAVVFKKGKNYSLINYTDRPLKAGIPQTNRLYSTKQLSGGSYILGFDLFLLKINGSKKIYNYIYPVKSVDEVNKDSIIAGTSYAAFIMRSDDLKIIDTVWRERCTKVFSHANKYYIGTLAGLYEVNKDKTYTNLGALHPTLTRRIADIKATADGTLWIATADQGLIAYKNKQITAVLKDSNGLSSNICKTLFLHNNYLWVGTNKGLDKIDISSTKFNITTYSSSDGLPSNIINAVYVEDSMVYVGSPAGLTVFNEKKISSFSICRLNVLQVTAAGKEFDSLSNILSYKENDIRFSYTGISLKSSGDITYHYKLTGLNNTWLQTAQSTIEYPSLPPGEYALHLYAVNKFGVKSNTVIISFTINAPFWQKGWFYALIIFSATGMAGWFIASRNKKYRSKLEASNAMQKQFASLEQQALQAQMNPHFIFNCLNGIQQYILTGDKEKANEYLTCFARLIRQTLDNSGKKTISVAQEVEYLKEYLEMEKMRSANIFTSEFIIDSSINADAVEIPAMLLQPYVENALRHGLRYKKNGVGHVQISVIKKGGNLLCIVKDNGVGRKYAAEIKSTQHIEYQSKGMSLTARRIDLLNKMNDTKLAVTVNDLYDNTNAAAGTEVIIQIPV